MSSKPSKKLIVEKTMHPRWLSNSWLLADHDGGHAVLIDTGGPMEPLLRILEQRALTLSHVLCTHHHPDHIAHNADWKQSTGCTICGGRHERELFAELGAQIDCELEDSEELQSGALYIRAVFTPGHTKGQVAYLINEQYLATGDTLFRASVGGTRGHGAGSYEQLRHSILDGLLRFPADLTLLPGHCEASTVGRELAENPFVRYWSGQEAGIEKPCQALGEDAVLLLEARDYDGGSKCLVLFEDGHKDIVPGSRVKQKFPNK